MNCQITIRISVLLGFLALVLTSLMGVLYWLGEASKAPSQKAVASIQKSTMLPPEKRPQPVDLQGLSERATFGGGDPSVAAPETRKNRLVAAQIASAGDELQSFDIEERIGGAEQLAAYPTREAEVLLVHAMETDMEMAVRRAAAKSLGKFEHPKDATIDALFSALADEDENVQQAASDTLISHVNSLISDSARYKTLLVRLKQAALSRRIGEFVREDIRDFLSTQKIR